MSKKMMKRRKIHKKNKTTITGTTATIFITKTKNKSTNEQEYHDRT
jgi:hypothetical protein